MDTVVYNENGRIIKTHITKDERHLQFLVYKKGNEHPYWSVSRYYNPEIDIEDLDYYQPTLKSLIENIVPIDPDSLPDYHEFEDYGVENGWTRDTKHPRLDQEKKDLKENPWLCMYEINITLARCYHRVINYTYKYTFTYDSSD